MHMRLIGAWDRQTDRLAAGCKQEPIIGCAAAVSQRDWRAARIIETLG